MKTVSSSMIDLCKWMFILRLTTYSTISKRCSHLRIYEKMQRTDLKLHYDLISKIKKTMTTSSVITETSRKKYDVCMTYPTKNKQLKKKSNILYKLNQQLTMSLSLWNMSISSNKMMQSKWSCSNKDSNLMSKKNSYVGKQKLIC